MNNYTLSYSILLKHKNNMPYDVILYNDLYYAGYDLFRNFIYFLEDNNSYPAKIFNNYIDASSHILSFNNYN